MEPSEDSLFPELFTEMKIVSKEKPNSKPKAVRRAEKLLLNKQKKHEKNSLKKKQRRHNQKKAKFEIINKLNEDQRKKYFEEKKEFKKNNDINISKHLVENKRCIYIDMSYTSMMQSNELKSVCAQLSHSVGRIRKDDNPYGIKIFSYQGQAVEILDQMGINGWPVETYKNDLITYKIDQNCIYLSPDSDNLLLDFDETANFVIGGIVDKTIITSASLIQAYKCNIKAYRLPLKEFVPECTRFVLNIDTVVELLIKYSKSKDWRKNILEALPSRYINQNYYEEVKLQKEKANEKL